MRNDEDFKNSQIEHLNQENRDLKKSRSDATLAIVVILVAFWTIISTLISPILNPLNNESVPFWTYTCPNLTLFSEINDSCINTTYSSIQPDKHVVQFLLYSNTFDFLLFFGSCVTIFLIFVYLFIIFSSLLEERENNRNLNKFIGPRLNADLQKYQNSEYWTEIPKKEIRNLTWAFVINLLFAIPCAIGFTKIIPFSFNNLSIYIPIDYRIFWFTGDIISFFKIFLCIWVLMFIFYRKILQESILQKIIDKIVFIAFIVTLLLPLGNSITTLLGIFLIISSIFFWVITKYELF